MKPLTSVAALAALTILVAACASSGSAGTVPPLEPSPEPSVGQGSPDLTPAPSVTPPPPSTAPSGSPEPTPAPSAEGTTIVRAYFYMGSGVDDGVVPVLREVPKTKAVATAAMNGLLAGPDADSAERVLSSAIPAGTRLLGLTIKDGVATVDLSNEFESGGGSASTIIRLGQVVFTLTQFPTVDSVLFQIEGRPVTVFGSAGIVLGGPVGRADYEELLAPIFVDRPAFGAAIGNAARITGASNVFEATFRIAILDGDGRVIVDQMAMSTCGSGCYGTFDVTLGYDVARAQWGTLRVYAASAKDGSPEHVRDYPVWLTPAG
jgi:spore germination protein GerM